MNLSKKLKLPGKTEALPGRTEAMTLPDYHFVNRTSMAPPFPSELQTIIFGMGCFWGAEKKFWELEGVKLTAVGYAGGVSKNPSYGDVCSGLTGHNEVVKVLFDPSVISYVEILRTFWENHDPTQLNRQGNDIGTQYRSTILFEEEDQEELAKQILNEYQKLLFKAGFGEIKTKVESLENFYLAEEYHQDYLKKNPNSKEGFILSAIINAYALDKFEEAIVDIDNASTIVSHFPILAPFFETIGYPDFINEISVVVPPISTINAFFLSVSHKAPIDEAAGPDIVVSIGLNLAVAVSIKLPSPLTTINFE